MELIEPKLFMSISLQIQFNVKNNNFESNPCSSARCSTEGATCLLSTRVCACVWFGGGHRREAAALLRSRTPGRVDQSREEEQTVAELPSSLLLTFLTLRHGDQEQEA